MHAHFQTETAGTGPTVTAARGVTHAEDLEGSAPAGDFQSQLKELLEVLTGSDQPPPGLADLDALSRTVLAPLLDEAVITRHPAALLRCLHAGVPLWILLATGADTPTSTNLVRDWRTRAATALARPTDVLLAGQRTRAADLLTDVTRGVAALALQPGGVAFGGIIFCAHHSPGGVTVDDSTRRCPECPRAQP